uniref:Neurotrimin n=1 Tax=Xiphophorus couchianus TaxID=32473 RepID=A0A3B5MJX7_9TELE
MNGEHNCSLLFCFQGWTAHLVVCAENPAVDRQTMRHADIFYKLELTRTPESVDDVVTHTAWLNRSSILYAGEDKWSVDPRVSLVTLNQEEFTIKIENVDMTDEGQYVCAVQTSNATSFSLFVLVPPKIINFSRDIVVNEGSNVTLMCQAGGKPEPSIRDLASDDELLEISSISRQKAGVYECTAVNDIDTDVQTVDITVNYPPSVSEGRDAGVTLGQRGVLECEADAVPEADFEWYKDNRKIFNGFDGIEIINKGSLSKLTFHNVSDGDYGNYTCVAVNKLGSSNTNFLLYGKYLNSVMLRPSELLLCITIAISDCIVLVWSAQIVALSTDFMAWHFTFNNRVVMKYLAFAV